MPTGTLEQSYATDSHWHKPDLKTSCGVTGGGGRQSAPQRLLTGKFLLTYRQNRGKENRKNGAKKRKIEKGKVENLKMEGARKSYKKRWGFFFFFRIFRKNYFTPSEKYACYAPAINHKEGRCIWKFTVVRCFKIFHKHSNGKKQANIDIRWNFLLIYLNRTYNRIKALVNNCRSQSQTVIAMSMQPHYVINDLDTDFWHIN